MYEIVCLRANLDRCVETIDLMRFRKLVGVPPGAYERGDNFMRFVIRAAHIQMVRMHSRVPISAVKLTWWKKAGDEFRAAMQERNQSKQGRKARLESAIIPSSTTRPQLQLI